MAAASASVREYRTELQAMVRDARATGGALDSQAILGKAGELASATQGIRQLRSEMGELSKAGKEVGESMGESFRLGGGMVLRFRESLGSLREAAEAVGAAFVAEKIAGWAFEAAEAGEKTVNLAAAIGTTTERASELSAMMRLAGGEGDMLGRTVQILAQKTQEALENPRSTASEAFAKMGISVAQLQEGLKDPTTMIDRLAEAYQRFKEAGRGGEFVADLRGVAGRSGGDMTRMFEKGTAGLEELKAVAHETGAVIDEDLGQKMVETTEKVNRLGLAFLGLKDSIFKGLYQPLNEALEEATKLLENLSGARSLTEGEREKYWPQEWGPYDPKKRLLAQTPADPTLTEGGEFGGFSWTPADTAKATAAASVHPYAQSGNREGAGGAGPAEVPAGSQADRMRQWLSANGYSATAAAGIMGNAQIESGFNVNAGNGTAHQGLFQWDASRWSAGGSPTGDFQKQMELMDAELSRLDGAFKTSSASAGALASRFESAFERSGGQMLSQRVAAAQRYGGTSAPAPLTFQQADQANEARLAVQRSDAEREMQDAQRKRMGGEAGGDAAYKAATDKKRAAIAAQVAYENLGEQEKIKAYQVAANGQTAASVKASDEIKQLDSEMAKSDEALATRKIDQAERAAAAKRRVEASWAKEYEAGIAAKVKAGDFSAQQGYGYDIQAVQAIQPGQLAALRTIAGTQGATSDQKTAIDDQMREIAASGREQLAELQKEAAEAGIAAAEKFAAPFRSAFDKLGGSLESGITGLLEHKTTLLKVREQLGDSLIGSGVNMVGTGLSKAGGSLLGGKPGQGIGDVLGDKIGTWISQAILQITATSVNTAAITANTAAVSASAAAAGVSGAGSALSAAGSAGGIFSGLKTVFSWLPFAKGGYDVPSFAGGGWSIPGGLSMLHPKEMVLPANLAEGVRRMVGSGTAGAQAPGGMGRGDTHLHLHATAIDAPAADRIFKSFVHRNPGAIHNALKSMKL
jgi:hypothetical protein